MINQHSSIRIQCSRIRHTGTIKRSLRNNDIEGVYCFRKKVSTREYGCDNRLLAIPPHPHFILPVWSKCKRSVAWGWRGGERRGLRGTQQPEGTTQGCRRAAWSLSCEPLARPWHTLSEVQCIVGLLPGGAQPLAGGPSRCSGGPETRVGSRLWLGGAWALAQQIRPRPAGAGWVCWRLRYLVGW